MGMVQHHVIVATTWQSQNIAKVEKWIEKNVSEEYQDLFLIGPKGINKIQTVVMVPDGSNEGWPQSDECDEIRSQFKKFLGETKYFTFVEVDFGEFGAHLLETNSVDLYR